jgi:hypothetical protein
MGVRIGMVLLTMKIMVAVVTASIASTPEIGSCTTAGNATQCSDSGKEFIFEFLKDITLPTIDGAPLWVNTLWIMYTAVSAAAAVLLAVTAFIPFLNA